MKRSKAYRQDMQVARQMALAPTTWAIVTKAKRKNDCLKNIIRVLYLQRNCVDVSADLLDE